MAKIIFKKARKSDWVHEGTDLLDAYRLNPSLPFKFGCCKGTCGVCLIHVTQGQNELSPKTQQEKITLKEKQIPSEDNSYRLACQCAILGTITIE